MSEIKSDSLCLFLSSPVSADPEFRVFYWELVIDIAEVWVTNSSAYLHMIILGIETRQVILFKHFSVYQDLMKSILNNLKQ